MTILGDTRNIPLSESIANSLNQKVKYPEIHDFVDGEFRIRLLTEVTGDDVFVIKSFASPVERNLLEFLFTVDACRRVGAGRVFGICPYLPYMRADHVFRSGEAVPLEVMSDIFDSLKLEEMWTIDPHSIKLPEMFRTEVVDENTVGLFGDKIKELSQDLSKVSVVSPDMGGIRRIRLLAEYLNVPYVTVQKDRDLETGKTVVAKFEGEVREEVYLVDDIISSGGTMVNAAEALLENGAKRATVMATHAVFAQEAKENLQRSSIEKVYVTDSIEVDEDVKFAKLEILSLGEQICKYLRDLSR